MSEELPTIEDALKFLPKGKDPSKWSAAELNGALIAGSYSTLCHILDVKKRLAEIESMVERMPSRDEVGCEWGCTGADVYDLARDIRDIEHRTRDLGDKK